MDQFLSDLKEEVLKDIAKEKSNDSSGETARELPKTSSKAEKPLFLGPYGLCVIVSAVIVENGKVLLIKEAKKSCRGFWYLPAGKLKKNESLVEGVKREVHEESGLDFEPTSLICFDNSTTLSWQRFNFTGNVTGGKLKTIKDADKESMEAGWFEPREIFSHSIPLRATDIIPQIKSTLRWKEIKEKDPSFISLPVAVPHERITIQVVLVTHDHEGMKIFLDKEKGLGFLHCTPSTLCCSVLQTVQFIMKRALSIDKADYQLRDIITVEHIGKPHGVADGMCITLLAEVPTPVSAPNPARYCWVEVADERLKRRIRQLLEKGGVEIV